MSEERGLPEHLAELNWEIAYWQWCAKYGRRKRVWRSGWDRWGIGLYGDEFNRRTLVLGPFVFALWNCRCDDCKAEAVELQAVLDS